MNGLQTDVVSDSRCRFPSWCYLQGKFMSLAELRTIMGRVSIVIIPPKAAFVHFRYKICVDKSYCPIVCPDRQLPHTKLRLPLKRMARLKWISECLKCKSSHCSLVRHTIERSQNRTWSYRTSAFRFLVSNEETLFQPSTERIPSPCPRPTNQRLLDSYSPTSHRLDSITSRLAQTQKYCLPTLSKTHWQDGKYRAKRWKIIRLGDLIDYGGNSLAFGAKYCLLGLRYYKVLTIKTTRECIINCWCICLIEQQKMKG